MRNSLKIGDKVAYSVQWLASVGMSHSEAARARGVIEDIVKCGGISLACIKWDSDMPEKVNVANLAKVGPNRKFCNVD